MIHLDPELELPHFPRPYPEHFIAAPTYKYPNYSEPYCWTVYEEPRIVIWEFDNREEAEGLAKQLNDEGDVYWEVEEENSND